MAQSFSNVLLHIVYSTKNRTPWIAPRIQEQLWPYLGGACRDLGCGPHRIGGTEDHVHIACSLSRTMPVAQLVGEIKASSSKWIKTLDPRLAEFTWQAGYGAFSVGRSQSGRLVEYIDGQMEHHRRLSYQEELREFLRRYEIEYDERYVWD